MRKGSFQRKFGGISVVTATVIAVKPMIGIVYVNRHIRMRILNQLHIRHRNVRI